MAIAGAAVLTGLNVLSSLPQGLGFGIGYGLGVRIGYEQAYPRLSGASGQALDGLLGAIPGFQAGAKGFNEVQPNEARNQVATKPAQTPATARVQKSKHHVIKLVG